MFNGKIHYKWPFSIAMLNYQRVIFEILKHRMEKMLVRIGYPTFDKHPQDLICCLHGDPVNCKVWGVIRYIVLSLAGHTLYSFKEQGNSGMVLFLPRFLMIQDWFRRIIQCCG